MATRNFDAAEFISSKRAMVIRKFEMQGRYAVNKVFSSTGFIQTDDIESLYGKFDNKVEIAKRVMTRWDINNDGKLVPDEIAEAVSHTDGKFSLKTLDPDAEGSILGKLWELFIVGIVVFFLVSIVNEVARAKYAEVKAAGSKKKK